MAEALGLAASIFATVQIADRVISLCKRYIESIKDAPSDLRTILIETSAVKAILENVKFLLECDNGQSEIFDTLKGPSGPIEGCHEAMKSLEGLFRTDTAAPQGLSRSRKLRSHALVTLATLAWPLKESKARKLLQDVATYKSTIGLALAADTAHLMRDTARKTSQIQEALSESQRHVVFEWLVDIDPSPLHHRAQDNYEPGTCDWAARLPEWSEFLSGRQHCLWIYGIPGAGKTVLASQLIDKIEQHCDESDSERLMSIWYYCYFAHNQDESTSLLKWILGRLCRRANAISEHLWKLFKQGGTPSIKDLLISIAQALEHFDEVYITVDAIDESNPREDLLKVLRQLATEKRFNKIRLLLTSREYVDIETVMIEFSTSISMKNEFLDADIRLYTETRVTTEKRIKSWPAELRQETVEALSHGAQGMFRWVVCQIDALRRIRRREAIREALSRLPKTLNEAYDRIFEQIEDEDIPYVISAMKWLCFQAKVYAGEEAYVDMQTLGQAVDDDILGDNRQNPEGEDLLHYTESLREICGCLITVTPTTLTNGNRQQRSHVSFAHYTVLEYLASNNRYSPEPFFALEKDELVFDKAERIFARALCVSDDEFEEYGTVEWSGNEHHVITNLPNFGSYCAWVSIDIIISFDALLSKHSAFLCQVLDVLNADTASSFLLFSIWKDGTKNWSTMRDKPRKSLETIQWETMPDLEIQVLVRLLIFGCLHISKALLERMEPQKAFQACLNFKYNFTYVVGLGSALFPVTELCSPSIRIKVDSFKLLIEIGAGNFDPQGALIPFGPLHDHSRNCKNWCVLEKLLSLGANPNASGCYINPLQIAVATFDEEGVLALLQAGADPNAEGDPAASAWPNGKLLSLFNCLNGWRPLEICKNISDPEMFLDLQAWSKHNKDTKEKAKTNPSSIEAILLEYGAED